MRLVLYFLLGSLLILLGCNDNKEAKVDQAMFDRLSRELPTAAEMSHFSTADLRILRNSIFARHGYKFKSADLRKYFSQYSWYEPRYDDVYSMLNSIEKKNVEFFKSMEDRMANDSEPVVKLPQAEVNEAMFERLSRETPSVEELSQFTSAELRILRNSIFARHGYKFKSADLRDYFSRYSWYEARYADVLKLLNSVEKKNIDLLKAMEDSDGNVFIDARDGKTYKTVTIGTQVWMAENLNYKVNDSWCYANESGNCNKYGRLYKLSAARQACPAGWHLPRYKEWQKLSDFVDKNKGGLEFDATLMSKTGWTNDFGLPKGVDSFGFKALPAGMGDASFSEGLNMLAMFRAYETGKFYLIGYGDLGDEDGSVYDSTGLSVRCIKDK